MTGVPEPVVSLKAVNHYFGQGTLRKQILFDVTADIWPGELVMVMGPSGSGKTTMLTLMGALRSVSEGSLRILGMELHGSGGSDRMRTRQRIGFIFQQQHLLDSLTARQNVQMGLAASDLSRRELASRAAAMLGEVGLAGRENAMPSQLSGGQRQRVAVARALVRQPEVLLADEPTSALDRQTGREVVELLRSLARQQGCAVIMVTHDNRILDVADRLMYLEDGRLSSFAANTSTHAAHLLTALRPLSGTGQLAGLLGRMSEAEFVELVRTLGAESEQFLNVMELNGPVEARPVFLNVARAVLERVAGMIGARSGSVWANAAQDELRCVAGFPGKPDRPDQAVRQCLRVGAVSNQGGVLCVPLLNQEYEVFAVAEMLGESFAPQAERLFRDFARPLGILSQVCMRLEGHV